MPHSLLSSLCVSWLLGIITNVTATSLFWAQKEWKEEEDDVLKIRVPLVAHEKCRHHFGVHDHS